MYGKLQKAVAGTTQTRTLAALALVTLALSLAVGLKTTSAGAAFVSFALGAVTLLITLYDVNCVVVGKCDTWGWIKAILIGLSLLGMIWVQIMILNGSYKPALPLQSM